MPVTGHDGHQFLLPGRLNAIIMGTDNHGLFNFRGAGTDKFIIPLDFHDTNTAARARRPGHGIFESPITLKDQLLSSDCGPSTRI